MKKLFILFLVISLLPITAREKKKKGKSAQPVKKIRIGVLNFTPKNTSTMEAEIVNDMFRNELVDSGKFDVLDRNNMNAILGEQEFQQSGCTDSECAVQLGRILNMEHMIYGILMKAGKKFFISVEMIHVESSKITKSARQQFDSMNRVENAIVAIVEQLTGLKKKDLARFRFFVENLYAGILLGLGEINPNGVPEGLETTTAKGFDIMLKGRLFGKPKDVMKWNWYMSFNLSTDKLDDERNKNDNQGLYQAVTSHTRLWIEYNISPLVGINLRFGIFNIQIGGDVAFLFLREKAVIDGSQYTTRFFLPGLGAQMMFEFKILKHFSIFAKVRGNFFFYNEPNGSVLETYDIKYNGIRGLGIIGLAF